MRTNPHLPDRKDLRLKGYDYSREGAYFITICCQEMRHRFGKVINGVMHFNECGQIAHDEWAALKARYPHCDFDVFQIMPNHLHGIVVVGAQTVPVLAGTTRAVVRSPDFDPLMDQNPEMDAPIDDLGDGTTARVVRAASISDMMSAYKSIVACRCLEIYKSKNQQMGKLWLRSYDDEIIRDERAFKSISNYIINNPKKWNENRF